MTFFLKVPRHATLLRFIAMASIAVAINLLLITTASGQVTYCCSAAQSRCAEFPPDSRCTLPECSSLYSDGRCGSRDLYGPGLAPPPGTPLPPGSTPGGGTTGGPYTNPINPINTFVELVQKIAQAIASIGIPLVAILITWAGFLYVTAQGNEKKLEQAKQALLWALVGGAVIIGAYALGTALVNTIQNL